MAGKTTTEHREHFEQLIREAELSLKENPLGYKRKLTMLAALGYAYLFGVLLLVTVLIALCVIGAIHSKFFLLLLIKKKLGIVLLIVLYVLIKALWVKLEAPDGYRLNRKQHATLFAVINDVGRKLKAPTIHEIIITPEFNAAIQQTPRLGVFGWDKNTLIIGLSLMLGLSKEQFLAVVAHEFGHLSGNHNRFSGWIYRVRMTWIRIMEAFDQEGGWAHLIFGKFFDWYAPYFNAYSFALARGNEYEADAIAAEVTSPQHCVEALVQTYLASALIDKHYWTAVNKQIAGTAEVNPAVYTDLKRYLKDKPFTEKEKRNLLDKILEEKTGYTDTHPALKDRIIPYVKAVPLTGLPEENAAEILLKDQLPRLLGDFDRSWAEYNREGWEQHHEYLNESKQELERLERKQEAQELNDEELWDLAAWTEELKPQTDPLPYYRAYWAKNRENTGANYAMGRLLLDKGDPEGLQYLDMVMGDNHAAIPACELAYSFFSERGDEQKAHEYRLRAEKHMDLQQKAEQERATITKMDAYLEPAIQEEWLESIKEQLRTITKLKHVWLCRKAVHTFPEQPIYVLIYQSKWGSSEEKMNQLIIDTLNMPGEYFVIRKTGAHKAIAKKALTASIQLL